VEPLAIVGVEIVGVRRILQALEKAPREVHAFVFRETQQVVEKLGGHGHADSIASVRPQTRKDEDEANLTL
jgi:hypothetical protein